MQGKYSHYVNKRTIRTELVRNDLTYKAVADKMGVKSQSTVMHLINGHCAPTINKMIELSKILGQPVDVLFNLDELIIRMDACKK